MRKLKRYHNHQAAPADWRQTSDLTGSYELDGMIARTSNRDMAEKLQDHLMSDVAYQKRTGYNGNGQS